MTTEFSLWKSKDKALPDTITVDGRAFPIRSDFRTILKILAILADPEIIDAHRSAIAAKYLFVGKAPSAPWWDAFGAFLRCGDTPRPASGKRDFDYEFDAPEIYASFRMVYRISLYDAELHWWEFSALLNGLFVCTCPLSEKVRLRNLDTHNCKDRARAEQAKQSVQIPAKISRDDAMTDDLIAERLKRGEDISDLL